MMEGSTMSPADFAALSGSNEGFGGTGGWLWFLIVMFAIWGGGFGYGGNNQTEALNASMQRGFDNQNVMTKLDTLQATQSSNAYDNAQLINSANMNNMQSIYNLTNAINTNTDGINANITGGVYGITQALNTGFNSVNTNISNLSHQLDQCCCGLKTQMLQDKYDALQNEYNIAVTASANATQTQNILNSLGRYVQNPPVPPYYYGTAVG